LTVQPNTAAWNSWAVSDNHSQMPTTAADNRSDAELVRGAAAGERDAFAAIYERYSKVVYRFARLMSGSTSTADDVTQEVFVTLMRTLPRYEPGRASLMTYLYGIARNVTRNRLRRERRFVSIDAAAEDRPSPDRDPCSTMSHAQDIVRLRRLILALPSRYREAVILCDVHGMSYAETARVLDVPVGTVRSRLNRGRHLIAAGMREDNAAPACASRLERCVV
jgi:RNA polymerase sigma-70 factor (ECF subfamily)